MEETENKELKFFENIVNEYYTEKEIRDLDFRINIEDLSNNMKDIFEDIISVESVCKCIINSLRADIKEVVKDLNENWGYDIDIIDKDNEDTKKCLEFIDRQFNATKGKTNTSNALDMITEIIKKLQNKYNIL